MSGDRDVELWSRASASHPKEEELRTHLKRHLSKMSEGADEGFTLIELLVVLLILGILLAIAIPTFLTVTKSAGNTAASSNLQTALTGAETYYTTNGGSYLGLLTSTTVSTIQQEGTGLSYITTASSAAGVMSVDYINPNDIALAAWASGTSRCYFIVEQKQASGAFTAAANGAATSVGAYYGYESNGSQATCLASNFATPGAGVLKYQTTGGFPS